MGLLFKRDGSVIGKHIKNVLQEECQRKSVWAKFARTGSDYKTYEVDQTRIARHISNIYHDGELELISTCAKNAQVRTEGNRKIKRIIKLFNLDMIIFWCLDSKHLIQVST